MLTQWQNLVVCTSLPGDALAMTWLDDHMIEQTSQNKQTNISNKEKGTKTKNKNTLAIYRYNLFRIKRQATMALGHQAVSHLVTDWCPTNPVIPTPASWVT